MHRDGSRIVATFKMGLLSSDSWASQRPWQWQAADWPWSIAGRAAHSRTMITLPSSWVTAGQEEKGYIMQGV